MKRESVSSSTVYSAGYDARKRVLEIQFTSGDVYQYLDVPGKIYDGLMKATSQGKYFNLHIKEGGFPFKKIS